MCVFCGVCVLVCVCVFVYFVVCVFCGLCILWCVCARAHVCVHACVCVPAYVCVCVCVCRLMWWSQLSTAHKVLAWLVLWPSTPFPEHDTDIPHGLAGAVAVYSFPRT